MKKFTILLIFIINLLAFSLVAAAEENKTLNGISFDFGCNSETLIEKYPTIADVSNVVCAEGQSYYYLVKDIEVFNQKVNMTGFSFKNDKLYQVDFFFENVNAEAREEILKCISSKAGKPTPIIDRKKGNDIFQVCAWVLHNTEFRLGYSKEDPQDPYEGFLEVTIIDPENE